MLTPEENEVLTRVTGDAPMAKLMRWATVRDYYLAIRLLMARA